ncbi:S53 family peptidase [Bacillus cereus]|uniref:S53 family peptidase n=1 Tax=Bacillus cereus TaxID=1396 RepID=UPI00211D6561|nr:S53 family peptidase [Bacillus cereus]
MKSNNSLNDGNQNFIRVLGSERNVVPGARKVSSANPDEQMSVTIVIRRPKTDRVLTSMMEETGVSTSPRHNYLTHEEFASAYGANLDDLKKVEEFAHEYHLEVKEVNIAAGNMVLTGTVSSFSKAFAVELDTYEHLEFTYRGRIGHVHIPENLANIVEAVLGLDNRPQVSPHIRILKKEEGLVRSHSHVERVSYTPPEVAALYNFPSINCKDQCIGIIELGGGYLKSDLKTYFDNLDIPQPNMIDVSINGATNQPGIDLEADGEVALDIEVAASVAPGAKIAVYFAPNDRDSKGFYDAITRAIQDSHNKPSVISISWGGPESAWTGQLIATMNRAFQDAMALGITICCASGDNGSSDYRPFDSEGHPIPIPDHLAHVDFPASSPFVLSCGGTRLEGSGRTINSEVVWNEGLRGGATGGGISDKCDLPSWQPDTIVPLSINPGRRVGRGVPDVAGNADPNTGYQILVNGQPIIMGGTSAVAPLWAGLIANINQKLGHRVGFINPILYNLSNQSRVFHDITIGDNSYNSVNGYQAQSGWDPCTGLGTPDGIELFNQLNN